MRVDRPPADRRPDTSIARACSDLSSTAKPLDDQTTPLVVGRALAELNRAMRATRKVVFLDVDGVLNSLAWRQGVELPPGYGGLIDPLDLAMARRLDPNALDLLVELARTTRAELVLSSTWRIDCGAERLERLFAALGFDIRFAGHTPLPQPLPGSTLVRGRERGEEIAEWLDQHPDVESIVILDDDDDMSNLRPWLIQTAFEVGLTRADIDQAAKLLEQPGPRALGLLAGSS